MVEGRLARTQYSVGEIETRATGRSFPITKLVGKLPRRTLEPAKCVLYLLDLCILYNKERRDR